MFAGQSSAREVVDRVLEAVHNGDNLDHLAREFAAMHGNRSTYPADLLLQLAADAYLAGGWTRDDPLVLDRIDERLLADWPVSGSVARQKRRDGLHGAILIAAGAQPEGTGWWRVDDLWLHSFQSVIILVRAAAEHRGVSVANMCEALRTRR